MKSVRIHLFLYMGCIVLIPILIILLFYKDAKVMLDKKYTIEKYLPGLLYEAVDESMQMETLKAMAVIMRSNTAAALEREQLTFSDLQKILMEPGKHWGQENRDFYEKVILACEETEGEVVFYQNQICPCPYFRSSNGTTRDAYTYFQDDSYPYVVPVPSHKDEESDSYLTYHHFSQEDFSEIVNQLSNGTFQNQIEILKKDASGYVLWMKIGDQVVGGELFRYALGLSSSCFSIEQEGEGIRIACKGIGHGFGFSLYGADAMAADKTYQELLAYYFHNIKVKNMYTFS